MLRSLRQTLTLLLFTLLPFHALFVTVGTKLLLGAGHPPLVELAVWKELLIAAILLIGIVELASSKILPTYFQYINILKVSQRETVRVRWGIDAPTILILALLLLALALSATHYSHLRQGFGGQALLTTHFVFGFKYLFLPIIFFLVLKNLSWDADFLERSIFPVLTIVGGGVAAYGILTFLLPQVFFSLLGYSDAHSLYSPHTPLSAFQLIADAGIRRVQSTFAGPNQLGMWLLLSWSISLVVLLKKQNAKMQKYENAQIFTHVRICVLLMLIGTALFLTFSRAAWIAAFVIALVAVAMVLRGPVRETILITLVTAVGVVFATLAYVSPQLFLRGISNQHHLERLRSGVAAILAQPLGRGLGTAGPAANRLQDACVYFPDGADTSWARSRKDLCIFVGNEQVQPLSSQRECQCAFLPENWYLQVGVELGVLGLILFIALVIFILQKLSTSTFLPREAPAGAKWGHLPPFLSFLGISIAALFLHAWEDSAVAYTVWGMAGIALAQPTSSSFLSRLRAFCPRWWGQR